MAGESEQIGEKAAELVYLPESSLECWKQSLNCFKTESKHSHSKNLGQGGEILADRVLTGESEDVPRVWVVGTATSVPGRTKEQGAQIIVDSLHRAAQGEAVLEKPGQRGAWLNKRFIATELNAGDKTWKFFKRHYGEIIELDEEQQWVRLRGLAP